MHACMGRWMCTVMQIAQTNCQQLWQWPQRSSRCSLFAPFLVVPQHSPCSRDTYANGVLCCCAGACACLQDQIAALGPWGGALFVVTVMLAEMVPLFPTQPLTLASGLLFGPVKVRTGHRQ